MWRPWKTAGASPPAASSGLTPPAARALDTTFGSGGTVLSSLSNNLDEAFAVTVQPDGKIVTAGGTVASGSSTEEDFFVARYNANGTLDTSFGTGGHTTTDFNRLTDHANAVALQADGKILAAGWATARNGSTNVGLLRYNANGTLDTSFGGKGSKGLVMTNVGGGGADAIVVQPDGKIVVADSNAGGLTVLARYTADGTLDTTFGSGGKLVTNIRLASQTRMASIALQGDGKIVLAGTVIDPATSTPEFVVARFNSNGTTDSTFGSGGMVIAHPGYTDHFGGVAIQGDGKIVVSGSESSGYSPPALYLLRLNTAGTPDTGFGPGGILAIPSPAGPSVGIDAHGIGPVIQSDGEIIASGQFYDATAQEENLAVVRVKPDSSVDVGFGDSGWATVQFALADTVEALALQPDGRVLLAGYARPTPNTVPTDVALVRFLASAPQIGSFTANPNPVTSGSTTTLAASSITDANPSATVAQVAFYIMIDGSGVLLGNGTHNSDGSWSYAFDTTGYAPGTYTLGAQATDSYTALGNPVSLTLTIQ